MKKYSTVKKFISALLAVITLLAITSTSSLALAASEGGADLYIGSEVTHYDDISEAWSKAMSTEKSTKLVLMEDWIADENGSFGRGEAFPGGGIGILDRHKPFTLDLNGYKIDRGLTSAKSNGYVFKVSNASFITITDSSEAKTGVITGGFNKDHGGAFKVEGSILTVRNITIKGNESLTKGGAFWIEIFAFDSFAQYSKVTLDNCTVTENKAKTGGAVYIEISNRIRIFDTSITNNSAIADGGIHTEVYGLFTAAITLGGKVVIADNNTEKDGEGLMLDESLFTKIVVEYEGSRPLSKDSRIVVLSKTGDNTLRITKDSDSSNIECFEYENDSYKIVAKGSGSEQYLDIKKN